MVKELNKDNFKQEVLDSDKVALVDFFADWCGPCKMVGPIVDQIASENSDINVCKINVDEQPELAARYNVMSIPTLISFKDGQELKKSIGLVSKDEILALVK